MISLSCCVLDTWGAKASDIVWLLLRGEDVLDDDLESSGSFEIFTAKGKRASSVYAVYYTA